MSEVVNIDGEDAVVLRDKIAMARIKCPWLHAASDEEVILIFGGYALTTQEEDQCG